jgi:5-formyltetrahydrofolate cyclo-ligase
MGTPKENSKQSLRGRLRKELESMTVHERAAASAEARARLQSLPIWREARQILFFAPTEYEPDVWPLVAAAIEAGKTAALPRFEPETGEYAACQVQSPERDVCAGQFGVREPNAGCGRIDLKRLDLTLVPGVGFDLEGHRLGRGKGFYDRLLAAVNGLTCGVAFDQQIVDRIPIEPHDVRLSCILTPTRWQLVAGPRAVLK